MFPDGIELVDSTLSGCTLEGPLSEYTPYGSAPWKYVYSTVASHVVVPEQEGPFATVPLHVRFEFQALAVVVAVWANATEKADTSTTETHAL